MHVRVPRVRAERTGVHSAVLAGVCGEQVDVRCPCLCAARHALPRAVRERDPHLCARRPSVRRPAVCGTRARAASVRARCPPVCSAPRVKRLRALHHPALCPQDDYIRSWEDGQPPDEGTEGGVGVGCRGERGPVPASGSRSRARLHSLGAPKRPSSPCSPGEDSTKDPCQKVKCSRHKVCVPQGPQRAVCVSRKKLEHR